jgi:sugar/nucleoside kinase (ribokinase family)
VEKKYDVMAAGHLCLDLIPAFTDSGYSGIAEIMSPGKLVQVGQAMISTGGPVSNTGIGLKKLGCRVCFCARTGDDVLGSITIGLLKKSGNAEGIRVIPGAASSYTVVIAPPRIDRIFLHNPGTNNEFCGDDLDPGLIGQCRIFHFGYPPLMRGMFRNGGAELKRVFQIARDAGAITSCDMALPDPASESGKASWRKILADILPYIDLFLPSAEETLYMLEPEEFLALKKKHGGADLIAHLAPSDYGRLSDTLLAMGANVVALKSGHRGFYLRTGKGAQVETVIRVAGGDARTWADREIWGPAFRVEKLASATGSGDSSIAGFIAAFSRGFSPEKTVRFANCLGWQNVQVMDAVSGIRTWDETAALVAKDLPQEELTLSEYGWRWDETEKLWRSPRDAETT